MSEEYNVKCKYTIARRLFIIAVTFLVLSVVFCLGFVLSELSYTARHQVVGLPLTLTSEGQIEDFHQFVYLYDTEEKIEDYHRVYLAELGLFPESPQGRLFRGMLRERPLARVGPLVVYASNDNHSFIIRNNSPRSSLVELYDHEQIKRMSLADLREKGYKFYQIAVRFNYSDDDVYTGGSYHLNTRDGRSIDRTYYDNTGSGDFDTMWVVEDGMFVVYRLNGLTWEREEPQLEKERGPRGPGMMLPPFFEIQPPGAEVEHSISNENDEEKIEQ